MSDDNANDNTSENKDYVIVEDGVSFNFDDSFFSVNMTQIRHKENAEMVSSTMTVLNTKADPLADDFAIDPEYDTMITIPLNEGLVIKLVDILLGFKEDYTKLAEKAN